MMADRELLEAAAKAAGVPQSKWDYDRLRILGHNIQPTDCWNPLTDDGDRYRLIKTLRLNIDFYDQCVWKRLPDRTFIEEFWHEEGDDADPELGDEAHAVLRAAVEVGKRNDL